MVAYNRRKWYHNLFLEFYISVPFLTIQTRLFKEAVERLAYDICRVNVRLWKWEWDFKLYKRPDYSYYASEQPVPRVKGKKRLTRALAKMRVGKKPPPPLTKR